MQNILRASNSADRLQSYGAQIETEVAGCDVYGIARRNVVSTQVQNIPFYGGNTCFALIHQAQTAIELIAKQMDP